MAKKGKDQHVGKSRIVPDQYLWTKVAETIEPIQKTRFSDLVSESLKSCTPLPVPPLASKQQGNKKSEKKGATQPPFVSHRKPVSPPAAPINSLDRRTKQKLTRGNVDIEARLDLHGHGVEIARVELKGFLTAARVAGKRTVLVITGKGCSPYARHTLHGASHFDSPERAGRLRRLLPDWLAESDLRPLVAGFQPAHPRHGGGGAYYIRLRRVR